MHRYTPTDAGIACACVYDHIRSSRRKIKSSVHACRTLKKKTRALELGPPQVAARQTSQKKMETGQEKLHREGEENVKNTGKRGDAGFDQVGRPPAFVWIPANNAHPSFACMRSAALQPQRRAGRADKTRKEAVTPLHRPLRCDPEKQERGHSRKNTK